MGDGEVGFAFVACEVHRLAQLSSSAAKEIKELIDESGMRVLMGDDVQ
jgi:methyl-accepting chemotaxis protein